MEKYSVVCWWKRLILVTERQLGFLQVCGGGHRRTELEQLLSLFDQSSATSDPHFLSINENDLPKRYRPLLRRLQKALADPVIRQTMDAEDDLIEEIRDYQRLISAKEAAIQTKDRLIEERNKTLSEKQNVISEQEKVIRDREMTIEEKERIIEDKERAIGDKEKVIEDKERVIEDKKRTISEQGRAIEEKERTIEESRKKVARAVQALHAKGTPAKDLAAIFELSEAEVERIVKGA